MPGYGYESTEGADKAKAAIPWAEASVAKKANMPITTPLLGYISRPVM
ncbi:MAG: hypothetical protein IPI42_06690 [Saprospiraceae bacterium]|nr:hypothetical protein [Candidatus Parvibacillus calidus]